MRNIPLQSVAAAWLEQVIQVNAIKNQHLRTQWLL